MQERRGLMGHRVAVVALSRHRAPYVPISDASFYSLFPDVVRRAGGSDIEYRLADIRVQRDPKDGKLRGHCVKWWEVHSLLEQRKHNVRGIARVLRALEKLQRALERSFMSPFGVDLPVFVTSAPSCVRALDWDALEFDVFRGLNSQVPFDYHLSRRARARIMPELPFMDFDEHFDSVVTADTLMMLMQRMLEQHVRQEDEMTLIPARWIKSVAPDDTVVVAAEVPMVLPYSDPLHVLVRVGALDVLLRRSGTSRRPRRRRRCKVPVVQG